MRVQRIGEGATVAAVLRGLHARSARRGTAAPAALTGAWFGATAVLVPSLDTAPCAGVPEVAGLPRPGGPDGAIGGGWVGFVPFPGEPSSSGAPSATAVGGWTEEVLRRDAAGCWWYESLAGASCPDELATVVRHGAPARSWSARWTAPDAAAHQHAVRQCLAAIAEGEVYQACVCTRFTGELDGPPGELFADGVAHGDPARAALVQGPWGAVVSFSPELFLARRGRTVRSSPIKGTLPRTEDPARLRASAKDVAENVMIVDLVRNDLGRVCAPGSIRVPELLAVHPAPAVWHLVSTVVGELAAGTTDADLLSATFPPASVTGTPKLRAQQLLAGWEDGPRGAYCGAVGMSSPVAGLELNVAIRTVQVDARGNAVLGVGGGITIDSDPAAEWQECLVKASAVTGLTSSAVTSEPAQPRAASTAS